MKNKGRLSLAIVVLLAAALGGNSAPAAVSFGWYEPDFCDDAEAFNPGARVPCRYDARETSCADGVDNDSDERTDCADGDCSWASECQDLCDPAVDEICDNGRDDNCDGLADGGDPDCCASDWRSAWTSGLPLCGGGCARSETDSDGDCQRDDQTWLAGQSCADGSDAEGDGLADCDDPDCAEDSACKPVQGFGAPDGASETLSGALLPGADVANPAETATEPTGGSEDFIDLRCPPIGPYGPNENCHDRANDFCDANSSAQTRVVQCRDDDVTTGQGVSVTDSYRVHTINLFQGSDGLSQWCLADQGKGGTDICCFTDYSCSADDVSLAAGSPGEQCAQRLCMGQYKPESCRALADGERAKTMSESMAACLSAESAKECVECCAREEADLKGLWLITWKEEEEKCGLPEGTYAQEIQTATQACFASCWSQDYGEAAGEVPPAESSSGIFNPFEIFFQ